MVDPNYIKQYDTSSAFLLINLEGYGSTQYLLLTHYLNLA